MRIKWITVISEQNASETLGSKRDQIRKRLWNVVNGVPKTKCTDICDVRCGAVSCVTAPFIGRHLFQQYWTFELHEIVVRWH